jgi:hypothetical protein
MDLLKNILQSYDNDGKYIPLNEAAAKVKPGEKHNIPFISPGYDFELSQLKETDPIAYRKMQEFN